jgi:Zn-dependent protease/CBS domain-containing protein
MRDSLQLAPMRSFKIGSAFGIPIKLDITFLLILPVFAFLIGTQVETWIQTLNGAPFNANLGQAALTEGNMDMYLGIVAAVGLFTAVVLHELGHSVVAMHFGYPIDSITLWILGGIANLSEQPEEWSHELLIAVAGPVVSVALGALSYLAMTALPTSLDFFRFLFGYLALMNVALAAFNLLPGFPMDGGRVLRALLARTRPYAQATQIAAEVGKAFAILLGIVGLLGLNLILIAIAFFIYIGASSEAQRTVMNAAFQNVRVEEVMTPVSEVHTIDAEASVADLMERMFDQRHTGYPVTRNGEVVGMVTLDDASTVKPVERDAIRVEEVMSDDVQSIPSYRNAMEALEAMQQEDIGRLIVLDAEGELDGLISRTDLMTAFDVIQSTGPRGESPANPTEHV